jgi:hypothetical protein
MIAERFSGSSEAVVLLGAGEMIARSRVSSKVVFRDV